MVCRNPLLAEERARKREELLRATEALLDPVVAATRRDKWRLKGADRIGVRVGKVVGKYKMAKHFELDIEEDSFGYRRSPGPSPRGRRSTACTWCAPAWRRRNSTPRAPCAPTSA